MKKLFLKIYKLITLILVLQIGILPVLAQNDFDSALTTTLIPEVNKERFRSNYDCTNLMKEFEEVYFFRIEESEVGSVSRFFKALEILNGGTENSEGTDRTASESRVVGDITSNDILGCSIVTGRISLSYLSIFVSYALRMLTILAGTASILFIIIGGYQYVIGGITESQDGAKNTIKNAIIGLVVSTSAWIIVNIVLALLTS